MYSDTQCINCGGYKVTESTERLDPVTGRSPDALLTPKPDPTRLESWLIQARWRGPIAVPVIYFFLHFVALPGWLRWLEVILSVAYYGPRIRIFWWLTFNYFDCALLLFGVFVLVAGNIANQRVSRRATERAQALWHESLARSVREHAYHCDICGRRWTWREDEPMPTGPSSPRASLLEMGARRLEKEQQEQERKRQQELRDRQNAAAAGAWQRHLRGEI